MDISVDQLPPVTDHYRMPLADLCTQDLSPPPQQGDLTLSDDTPLHAGAAKENISPPRDYRDMPPPVGYSDRRDIDAPVVDSQQNIISPAVPQPHERSDSLPRTQGTGQAAATPDLILDPDLQREMMMISGKCLTPVVLFPHYLFTVKVSS